MDNFAESGAQQRIAMIEAAKEAACRRAGRDSGDVRILAVSKTHGPEAVSEVAECGILTFGESRVQEARGKIPLCPGRLSWHFIGHLQANKAKYVPALFDMVHSVDSIKLAIALDKACAAAGRRMPVCIEVNTGGEQAKFGFDPSELIGAVDQINRSQHLEVMGLMTLPPYTKDPAGAKPYFASLRELRDDCVASTGIPLPELSMGMSRDFETAIEEGSTWIRLGSVIFGERGEAWKP